MADRKYIKIGTKVITRFGEAKVTGIELCESHSEKYGISVDKIYVADKDLSLIHIWTLPTTPYV